MLFDKDLTYPHTSISSIPFKQPIYSPALPFYCVKSPAKPGECISWFKVLQ